MAAGETAEFVTTTTEPRGKFRVAQLLSWGIFGSLLALIVSTAVPYGTVEAWWKALFACVAFLLGIAAIVEGWLSGFRRFGGWPVLMPLAALAAFSFLQTIPLGRAGNIAGVATVWDSISADPYQTRFFILQLLALATCLALFYRYAAEEKQVRVLIHVIIGVTVASALFGIIRQTTQHQVGFGLPRIQPEVGYGQFINKNHFAFLMEMGFGLAVGFLAGGTLRRETSLIYLASLLPIWTGLVLSNSRGGVLAMLVQFIIAALLWPSVFASGMVQRETSKALRLTSSLPIRLTLIAVLGGAVILGSIWLGGDRLVSSFEAARVELDPSRLDSPEGVSRNEIWRATLQLFKAHPIAGVGLAGYWVAITAHHDAAGVLTPQEAHNEYLELLASGGIVGLGLGGWFVAVLFKRTRANLKSRNRFQRVATFGATIGIVGVAVHSLVDFGLHVMVNAIVFVALVAIATAKIEPDRRPWGTND